MLRHYTEVKAQYPDAVLLYRMGDFYEVFFDDAVEVAPVLEVALTARHKGKESETPMCGVPHHALGVYLAKLVKAGYKAAICDQVEDPAQAKGLVKREVVRVVTPGTLSDPELLDGGRENLLASVAWDGAGGAAAYLDVSTGDFWVRRWADREEARADLRLQGPRELLVEETDEPAGELATWIEKRGGCATRVRRDTWFDPRKAGATLERQFGTATLRGFGLSDEDDGDRPAVRAAALALAYARETQKSELPHIRGLTVRQPDDSLIVDDTTLRNLEVFENQRDGGRRGTLLGVLDETVTPPGARLLRDWLRRPARSPAAIENRLEAVAELAADEPLRRRLRRHLRSIGDPVRLLTRAVLGALTPREAAALRGALETLPAILADLAAVRSGFLAEVAAVDPMPGLAAELTRVLAAEPAAKLDRGGVIRDGVDEELDRVRSLARDSKKHLLALEEREREATGIASLKVKFNKVFGYYLEVTKANQALVPERYERKQTLVNAERYVTPELKELESQILSAEDRQITLEREHFERLRQRVVDEGEALSAVGREMARLDVAACLAEVAARHRYVRPEVTPAGSAVVIEEGRHPVVERLGRGDFVPNDVELGAGDVVLLTGPNMGGKSTYLRQVALIVLMAQAGSFVPAKKASISAIDRVFTRVGASDDLTRGESTFMVEMVETANILHQATADSLVVLDEVGRGTATFDGLSLAWAIVEHLHQGSAPRTLFATHYHELTELAAMLPRVSNRTMAVKEWDNRIVFLHKVVLGSADKSYGLHVARLAGIPAEVIERAAEVLGNLESHEYDLTGRPRLARGNAPETGVKDQLNLFAPAEEVVGSILRDLDVERLSPLAALNLLHSLKSRFNE